MCEEEEEERKRGGRWKQVAPDLRKWFSDCTFPHARNLIDIDED